MKHLENIDGFGTAINRSGDVYANYMERWKTPSRTFLWLSSAAVVGYAGWKIYSAWINRHQPKHRPIGIEERSWENE